MFLFDNAKLQQKIVNIKQKKNLSLNFVHLTEITKKQPQFCPLHRFKNGMRIKTTCIRYLRKTGNSIRTWHKIRVGLYN